MFRLEKVSERTFRKVVDMKLSEPQTRYVAPNVVSLAQAWLYYDETLPLAICDGDEVVGFVMLDWDENERTVGVWRFMIAPEQQGKGYGRKALEAVLHMARDNGNIDLAHLDYVPGNDTARGLYYSLGFRENGDIEDGEIIMTLPLTDSPKVGMTLADEEDVDELVELLLAQKQAGAVLPTQTPNETSLRAAVGGRNVMRMTLLGEMIGFAVGGELLLNSESKKLEDEAKKRLAEGLKKCMASF